MIMILKGRTAVITGGSRGIGYAIAAALAKKGHNLLLVSRTRPELVAAKSSLESGSKVKVEICPADVSSERDVKKIAELIKNKFNSRIDILVNAAGVYGPIGSITQVDPEEWLKAIRINLFGTFLMIQMAVSFMQKRRRGKVINFSGGGEGAYPNFSSYVAAKGGLIRLTETAAEELKNFNIDVNAIAPGAVNTKFLDDLFKAGPKKAGPENYARALKQKKTGGVSTQKAAELVIFLASDASNGLSGKIFSAVWDDYDKFPRHIKKIMNSDVYTMRRIKPSDRKLTFD